MAAENAISAGVAGLSRLSREMRIFFCLLAVARIAFGHEMAVSRGMAEHTAPLVEGIAGACVFFPLVLLVSFAGAFLPDRRDAGRRPPGPW